MEYKKLAYSAIATYGILKAGDWDFIPERVPGIKGKVKKAASWGGNGGYAASFQGLPWCNDTFHV